jgi:hypothetical protein
MINLDMLPPIIITALDCTSDAMYNPSEQPLDIKVTCIKPTASGGGVLGTIFALKNTLDSPLNDIKFIKPFVMAQVMYQGSTKLHKMYYYGNNMSILDAMHSDMATVERFEKNVYVPNIKNVYMLRLYTGWVIDTEGTELESVLPGQTTMFPSLTLIDPNGLPPQGELWSKLKDYITTNKQLFGISVYGTSGDWSIHYPSLPAEPSQVELNNTNTGATIWDLAVSLPLFDMEAISLGSIKQMVDEKNFNTRLQNVINADEIIDGQPVSILKRPWVVRSGDKFRVVMLFDKMNFLGANSGVGNKFYLNYKSFSPQIRSGIMTDTTVNSIRIQLRKQAVDTQDEDRSFVLYDGPTHFTKTLTRAHSAGGLPVPIVVVSSPLLDYGEFSLSGDYSLEATLNVIDGLHSHLSEISKTFPISLPTQIVGEGAGGADVQTVSPFPAQQKSSLTFLLKLLFGSKIGYGDSYNAYKLGTFSDGDTGIDTFVDIVTSGPEVLKQYGYKEQELSALLGSISSYIQTNTDKTTESSLGSGEIHNFRQYTKKFNNMDFTRADNSFSFFLEENGNTLQSKYLQASSLGEIVGSAIFKVAGSHDGVFVYNNSRILPALQRSKYRSGQDLNLVSTGVDYKRNLSAFFEMLLNIYEHTTPLANPDNAIDVYRRKAKKVIESLPFATDVVENKNFANVSSLADLSGEDKVDLNAMDVLLTDEVAPIQGFLNTYLIDKYFDIMGIFRVLASSYVGVINFTPGLTGNNQAQYNALLMPTTNFEKKDGEYRSILFDPRIMGFVFNRQINVFKVEALIGFESGIESPVWEQVDQFSVPAIQALTQGTGGSSTILRISRLKTSDNPAWPPLIKGKFDQFQIEDEYIFV